MQANVVFHLDEDEGHRLTLALNNMENLFKEVPPAEADVRMVANGTAVRLFNRLLKNSRGSRCQRHGPGCKAPRRRRCRAHRLGAATQQAGPCRGNPSGARDWGPSALLRLLGRGPTLPSSPRLAYGPQASCARPMRVSQQPVKAGQPEAERIFRLSTAGARFLLCQNSLAGLAVPRESLLEPCEIVPAGILELVRLQHSGFAYVKP